MCNSLVWERKIRMAGPMWAIAEVMNWPPIFYSALTIVLLCKWTIWFPAMVVRHGLHGALDAALTSPRGAATRSLIVSQTNRTSDVATISAPETWTHGTEAGGQL